MTDATTLSEEDRAAARQRLALTLRAAAFGEIVALLMRSTSHRQMPLQDLSTLIAPAVLLDQYLVAKKTADDQKNAMLVGVVLWAKVTDEVDAQIRANPSAPIRLPMAEWNKGPHVWIVDLIAVDAAKAALLRDAQKRVGAETPIHVRTAGPDGQPAIRTLNELMAAAQSAQQAAPTEPAPEVEAPMAPPAPEAAAMAPEPDPEPEKPARRGLFRR